MGFSVAEGDLCPDPDLAADMRLLSVGLAIIGLVSPIVILCGCMLPITLCLGDISDSKMQRYYFVLRLLGNGVMFAWCIYGMSFVYTNPLIDTCLDPVRTVSDAMCAAHAHGCGAGTDGSEKRWTRAVVIAEVLVKNLQTVWSADGHA